MRLSKEAIENLKGQLAALALQNSLRALRAMSVSAPSGGVSVGKGIG